MVPNLSEHRVYRSNKLNVSKFAWNLVIPTSALQELNAIYPFQCLGSS